MSRNRSRLTEAELHAYIDDQLDAQSRIEVEDFLSENPDIAARVMADLALRDALRLAVPMPQEPHRRETIILADRLSHSLSWRRVTQTMTRMAAAVAIFALGWGSSLGWEQLQAERQAINSPALPAFVVDALRSHSSSLTRAVSSTANVDAAELARELAVTMPRLPEGWRILNAHLSTAESGAQGVEIVLDAPEIGQLSLLARHTDDVRIILPTFASDGEGQNIAYWQLVSNKYALTGDLPNEPLQIAALRLFQTLY